MGLEQSHRGTYGSLPSLINAMRETPSHMIRCFYRTFLKHTTFLFPLIPPCCKYSPKSQILDQVPLKLRLLFSPSEKMPSHPSARGEEGISADVSKCPALDACSGAGEQFHTQPQDPRSDLSHSLPLHLPAPTLLLPRYLQPPRPEL